MIWRPQELHLSDEYLAKYLHTIPEVVAAVRAGMIVFSKEQEEQLQMLMGSFALWYDDSDESQIQRLKDWREEWKQLNVY